MGFGVLFQLVLFFGLSMSMEFSMSFGLHILGRCFGIYRSICIITSYQSLSRNFEETICPKYSDRHMVLR